MKTKGIIRTTGFGLPVDSENGFVIGRTVLKAVTRVMEKLLRKVYHSFFFVSRVQAGKQISGDRCFLAVVLRYLCPVVLRQIA